MLSSEWRVVWSCSMLGPCLRRELSDGKIQWYSKGSSSIEEEWTPGIIGKEALREAISRNRASYDSRKVKVVDSEGNAFLEIDDFYCCCCRRIFVVVGC